MIVLLAKLFDGGSKGEKILSAIGMLPMMAFIVDSLGVGAGVWEGGIVSEFVFILIFVASIILICLPVYIVCSSIRIQTRTCVR